MYCRKTIESLTDDIVQRWRADHEASVAQSRRMYSVMWKVSSGSNCILMKRSLEIGFRKQRLRKEVGNLNNREIEQILFLVVSFAIRSMAAYILFAAGVLKI